MATIGLDKLFYSKITEGENGDETYATPVALAKAMTAELSVELADATLYADDGAAEVVKEFQSGTLTLGVDDIGKSVAEDLTGAVIDENGVLISASEDGGAPVAIGFRAKKANGKYRYFWLYRVIFGIPATNLTTKGEKMCIRDRIYTHRKGKQRNTEDEDHDNQRSNEKVQTAEPNHPGRPGMPVEQDLNLRGQDRDGGIFLQRTEPPLLFRRGIRVPYR